MTHIWTTSTASPTTSRVDDVHIPQWRLVVRGELCARAIPWFKQILKVFVCGLVQHICPIYLKTDTANPATFRRLFDFPNQIILRRTLLALHCCREYNPCL